MKDKVIFLKLNGEILALFPEIPYNDNPSLCMSYLHIGQHGGACKNLRKELLKASPQEYRELAIELTQIGYDLLILGDL